MMSAYDMAIMAITIVIIMMILILIMLTVWQMAYEMGFYY